MRAVITVAGKDRVGIIATVTQSLAQQNINVLDITQTILPPDFFTMVMLVDVSQSAIPFGEVADRMAALGQEMGMDIRAQREDTFQAMHRI
ncbi:MAG: ACT domain-containing protein [Clostridiales bacterium]|nr:ACT domain-containing protein [Clostridiales bacterium]